MIPPALPVCPQCQQTDQVQKVSAVYGMNSREWVETHARRDNRGRIRQEHDLHQEQTLLGQKLQPPEKPKSPTHPGTWYGLGILGVILLLSFTCPFLIAPVLAAAWIFADAPMGTPEIAGLPAWVVLAAGGLCLLVLGLAALFWGGTLLKRRYDRAMTAYRGKKDLYDREDLPRWEGAMRRWNELCICLRDETLFLPGEKHAIRLEDMQRYLCDPSFRG